MRRIAWFFVVALNVLVLTSMAHADVGGATSGGVTNLMFDLVQLVLALGCLLLAVRVFNMVRGGRVAAGWRFLAFGFAFLGVAQLAAMGYRLELISISFYWINVARVAALVFLMLGVSRIRRILT